MPKKTKKEKLLAQIRRSRSRSAAQPQSSNRPIAPQSSSYSLSLSSLTTATHSSPPSFAAESFPLLKRDLIKTISITLAIIALEIVLSRTLL